MNLPTYLKVVGIEGNLKGADVTWDWSWSGTEHGIAPPNIYPDKDRCIVTNDAFAGFSAVPPNAGVLTLMPKITCGSSEVLDLNPITLTVGLSFVEPVPPCCIDTQASGPFDEWIACSCGPVVIWFQEVDGQWITLGPNPTLTGMGGDNIERVTCGVLWPDGNWGYTGWDYCCTGSAEDCWDIESPDSYWGCSKEDGAKNFLYPEHFISTIIGKPNNTIAYNSIAWNRWYNGYTVGEIAGDMEQITVSDVPEESSLVGVLKPFYVRLKDSAIGGAFDIKFKINSCACGFIQTTLTMEP
jgi:hypothetical protein